MRKSTLSRAGGVFDKTIRIAACLALATMSVPAMSIAAFADEGEEAPAEASGNVAVSADVLKAALKDGSALELTTSTADKLSVGTEDELSFAKIAVGGEISTTINAESDGWLIFDWKTDGGTSGNYLDEFGIAVDGASVSYSNKISPSSSTALSWQTKVFSVAAGEHAITWSLPVKSNWSGSNEAHTDTFGCIKNVRFVTAKTAVSATTDSNTTATIASGGSEATEVAPGSSVTFTAAPADGYVVSGWKKSATATEYLTDSASYTTTVYDEPVSLYAESSKPWDGMGTESDPYQIKNVDGLKALATAVNAGNTFAGKYFTQTSSIYVASTLTESIGTSSKKFEGSYSAEVTTNWKNEPQYKSISGLKVPLFGAIGESGSVSNIEFSSPEIVGESNVGVVAGSSAGKIENVQIAYGKVDATGKSVGGVVGELSGGGSIRGCTVEIYHVISTTDDNTGSNVGGIAGAVSYNATIENCAVHNYRTNDNSKPWCIGGENASYVGGIAGAISGTSSTVANCVVDSDVKGKNSVGGIVGYLTQQSTVENSKFFASVSGVDKVGGIVGRTVGNRDSYAPVVKNSLSAGYVSASNGAAGGIVGEAENSGTVSGNAALAYSVNGKDGSAARIVGSLVPYTVTWGSEAGKQYKAALSDNYAYANTLVNSSKSSVDDATAQDGAALTLASLTGDEVVEPFKSWSTDAWTVTAGQMPQLAGSVSKGYLNDLPYYLGEETDKADAAFADPDSVSIASSTPDAWHAVAEEGQDSYVYGDSGASMTVTVEGEGWLIFDSRFAVKKSYPYDKIELTDNGGNARASNGTSVFSSVQTDSNTCLEWSTSVVKVDEGTHTIKFVVTADADGQQAALRNIRFVTEQTSISQVSTDGHATVVASEDAVAPDTSVTFTATADVGYVVLGFKSSADAVDYLVQAQTYTTKVYDSAPSLYVVTEKTPFAGTGTEADPYQLATLDDLKKLDEYVNAGSDFASQYFVLTADIVVDDTFKGIGSADISSASGDHPFCGNFDGNSKKISGLSVERGLFVYLGSRKSIATVKNLAVEGKVSSAYKSVGLIAGSSYANFEGCSVSGSVTSTYTDGNVQAGGLTGYISGDSADVAASIKDCTANVEVSVPDYKNSINGAVGGIVGEVSLYVTIEKSTFTGKVSAPNCSQIGGVAGVVGSLSSVSECYVNSDIEGLSYAGGIVGQSSSGIKDCLFQGDVKTNSGGSSSYAGGVVGAIRYASITIENCVATGAVVSEGETDGCAGGIVGCTENGSPTIKNCMAAQKSVAGTKAGRIVGYPKPNWSGSQTTVLEGNYAYAGTRVNGAYVSSDEAAVDNSQGAGVTVADMKSAENVLSVYGTWSTDVWNVEAGKLPTLKNVAADDEAAYPEGLLQLIDLADAKVDVDNPAYEFGEAAIPDITVTFDGSEVSAGLYDVSYKNADGETVDVPTAVGAYTVVVTAKADADCIHDNSTEFKVVALDITEDAEIKVDEDYDYAYSGKELTPAVVVTVSGHELVADTDYTVSYKNNIEVGTATAVVTGMGSFAGVKETAFEIAISSVDQTAVTAITNIVDALPATDKISVEDKAAIEAVRATYDGLTDVQKALSQSAAKKLEAAEDALAAAVKAAKEKTTADQAAADEVRKLVEALPATGSVAVSDQAAIEAARAAYDKLTEDQKALVSSTVLQMLSAVEEELEQKIADETPLTVGSTFNVETSAGVFTYKVTDSMQVELAKATKTKAKGVTVNTVKYKSVTYKVTSIGAKALKSAKLKKVTVGSNVTKIGARAFQNAKSLKTMTIGKNVKSVGAYAFKGAKKLTKITVLSKKLVSKKSVKNSLKGSSVKKVVLKKLGSKKSKVRKAIKKHSGKKSLKFK